MSQKRTHVIACADAWLKDAGQPTYTELLQKVERMNHTAAQPLDLDKLEAEVRNYDKCGYVRARILIADALALIAQARTAQLDTTASASIQEWKVGNLLTMSDSDYPGMGSMFAQVWQGEDLIARVYGDTADEVRERAALVACATLAPVAAQQAAAKAPAAQAVDARIPTEAMLNAARDWSVKKYGQGIGNDAAIGCWQAMYDASPASTPEAAQQAAEPFQQRVQPWMMACFGAEISADEKERNHRFFEESTELVQACGMPVDEAHMLVDYVYGRPVGEKEQEVGGVMVTLAALCLAQNLDMHTAAETELARIWTKVEAIRAKQASKPKNSPLPIATAGAATTSEDARDAARLDWLGQNFFSDQKDEWDERITPDSIKWKFFAPMGVQGDIRRVIDAAMRATQQEGGK